MHDEVPNRVKPNKVGLKHFAVDAVNPVLPLSALLLREVSFFCAGSSGRAGTVRLLLRGHDCRATVLRQTD